jgi:hypothetical protein
MYNHEINTISVLKKKKKKKKNCLKVFNV